MTPPSRRSDPMKGILVAILFFSLVSAYTEETKQAKNSGQYETAIQSPGKRVIRANVECTKRCNYRLFPSDQTVCFGSFQVDCFISQTFADGHVMETTTNINCVGEFRNNTGKGSDYLYIDTRCQGQFEQVQVINIFEPFVEAEDAVESLATYRKTHGYYNSYTCRSDFFYRKKLGMSSQLEMSYLSGNGDMTCKGHQAIKIQKDYCKCTKAKCHGEANQDSIFEVDPSDKQMVIKRSATSNAENSADKKPSTLPPIDVSRNFKIIAEHDPKLAQRVAEAIMYSVSKNTDSDVSPDAVDPVIREYYSSLNIYKPTMPAGPEEWSSNPTSAWLHTLCNGNSSPLSTACEGSMSASVRFNEAGEAFMMCKGSWTTYDYITYFCQGVFSEEESDGNRFGTFYSKASRCEGTVAITPLATRLMDASTYYGLTEVCNGKSIVQSSYTLEELDHRYLVNVIDPKEAQQTICLMTDLNCENLHYFTGPR